MSEISAVNQIEITAKDSSSGVLSTVEKNLRSLGITAESLAARFGTLQSAFAGLGGAFGVGMFAKSIADAIEYQASLANLAEQTGATVESLSAMRDAAKLSDTDMTLVAQGMQRFAAAIVQAQAGTGKQAEALKALGFNAQTFATQFKTTDQALFAVAQRLNEYSDGIGKTAIEQALLGKSGAQMGAFLRELAQDGLAATKVTTEQAQAARQLNDAVTKLKIAWDDLLNKLGVELVPVLTKVVAGFDTFAQIGAAALATFVAWPAVVSAVSAAWAAYRDAVLSAALANEVLGASTSVIGTSWAATVGSMKTTFLSFSGLLKSLPGILFAAFAGFELGKWLYDNFLEAKLAGIAFVDGALTWWENIKYGFLVAWASIKYTFLDVFSVMRSSASTFIGWLADGLSHLPGGSLVAAPLREFAAAVKPATESADQLRAELAKLGAQNDQARAKIHAITSDMAEYAIEADRAAKASAAAAKKPPPVPAGAAAALNDVTKALDAYQKAMAALQSAYLAAVAKTQLEAITLGESEIKRSYDQGLVDFKQYWDGKIALERTAIGIQEQLLQDQIGVEQSLVDKLMAQTNALDPKKFDTYNAYQKAWYASATALAEAQSKLVGLQGDLNVLVQKGADIGKDYIENYLIASSDGLLKLNSDLDKTIEQRQRENEQIGLTQSQIVALNISRVEEMRQNALLTGQGPDIIQFYDNQLDRLHKLLGVTAQGEAQQTWIDGWKNAFTSVADEGAKFIEDFVQHGSSAFKNLWDDFKSWALSAFAKIAAQTVVVNVAAALSPELGALAANTFSGGSGGAASLLTGGTNLLTSGGGIMNTLSNVGTYTGLTSLSSGGIFATGGALGAWSTGATAQALGISEAAGADATALTTFGTVLGDAIPVLGAVLAIGSMAGLFDHKPSPVKGQFMVSPGTSGFEDNAYTASNFGNLGFNDSNTQQFSGQAAQVFNQVVAGAIDAFSSRFSAEQSANFAQTLQKMVFPTMEGTFTTQDFLQKYGGQVLQQVITAAFSALDPALASVVSGFKGTADEVAKFGNTLLGIYDVTKRIGNSQFTANIDAALAGADQATADKVLAFAQIVGTFGDALPGVGAKLEALSGTDIPAFIDALGGAQAAINAYNYVWTNFTTTADKVTQATATLNADFASVGLTVPTSHQAYLDLLNSIDLTTAAGKQLYAELLQWAPLFVQIYGTADQAAKGMTDLSTSVSAATKVITQSVTDIAQAYWDAQTKGAADATTLITNLQGIAQKTSSDFGTQISQELQMVTDQISQTAATGPSVSTYSAYGQTSYISSDPYTNAYLATLQTSQADLADELARFTTLSAQYDSARAAQLVQLEDWYSQQQKLLAGNVSALDALTQSYNQQWTDIVNGTASGVSSTLDQLTTLKDGIAQYLQGLQVGTLSPLTPTDQLAASKSAFETEFTKALSGDQGAMGDVTQYADTYLQQAQGFYASSQDYVDIFNAVTQQLGALAGTTSSGAMVDSGTAAIVSALPVNGGTIASSDDLAAQTASLQQVLTDLVTALANANTADSQTMTAELQASLVAIQEELTAR